jgi:hypothetical protein
VKTALIVIALTAILVIAGIVAGAASFFEGWDE